MRDGLSHRQSGSGKSTLLRCINFLEEPTVGAIEVDGVDVDLLNPRDRGPRERIRQIRMRAQMVFQEFNLFPHLRVIDNLIVAPIWVEGRVAYEAVENAEQFLSKVGLRTSATSTRRDSRAARSSGSRSLAPCRWSRRCCCSTSRRRRSIRRSSARCCS